MITLKAALNPDQEQALRILGGQENVFLTGVAGSGKTHLIRHFLRDLGDDGDVPVLASTGAAALLLGGRTFHSFFGLGIMKGGFDATVDQAMRNGKLKKRLRATDGVIVDEVSMLSGETLRAAETIAREVRGADEPWGGLRVVVVGDFAQLPPVTRDARRDWAFRDEVWQRSEFVPAYLRTIMRSAEPEFLAVLNEVRAGVLTERVRAFLAERTRPVPPDFDGTRLFPHRDSAESYNLIRLDKIAQAVESFRTDYSGDARKIEELKRSAPVPETLRLKVGALVMLRMNDPAGRWVNGTLGHVTRMAKDRVDVKKLSGGEYEIERVTFSLLDADGHEVATARNFPLNLAYATTIHKAQGMTLDRLAVDLRNVWEPGQAYVALSRVRSAEGLMVTGWTPGAIKADPEVARFYGEIGAA